MSVVAGFDPTEIRLSDNAVNKLQVLIAEEEKPVAAFPGLHHRWWLFGVSVRLYLR